MHRPDETERRLAVDIATWAMDRLRDRATPPGRAPSDAPITLPEIDAAGIGADAAWAALRDLVLPSAVPTDHPRYLAFVPGAPSVAAVLADMAVSASGVYGGSQLEAGAVVAAERSALRWLADLAGLPSGAHGAFVSGGSMANLSALVVARRAAAAVRGSRPRYVLAGSSAHSSIDSAADVMGCDVLRDCGDDGRLDEVSLGRMLSRAGDEGVAAVVATAGATNTGAVDRLHDVAELCQSRGIWLHVDAAYGGAALLSARCADAFKGIDQADSITIDPHKWLFTPFDCAAVLYRDPGLARIVHAQVAPYLEVVNGERGGESPDNPADYALHLSRRPRGLPLWMSLVANGAGAYERAVDTCLDLAEYAAARIRGEAALELVGEQNLSVVTFRRSGWTAGDYAAWSSHVRSSGLGLITPTRIDGTPVLRLCFVNPMTTAADVDLVLGDLLRWPATEADPDGS